MFLGLPDRVFDLTWGPEWYIRFRPDHPVAGDIISDISASEELSRRVTEVTTNLEGSASAGV